MNERLREARLQLGLKQGEFASQLGLKQSSYSMMENGRCTLRENVIKSACLCFHINEHWLRTGEGVMFEDDKELQLITELASQLSPQNQKYLLQLAETMLAQQDGEEG
jgi:transcriptional regulator with XRE-family HTH domain